MFKYIIIYRSPLSSWLVALGKIGQASGQVFGDSKSKKATTNCVGSLTCTITDNTIIDIAMIINIMLMNKVFAKVKWLLAIHPEGMQRVDCTITKTSIINVAMIINTNSMKMFLQRSGYKQHINKECKEVVDLVRVSCHSLFVHSFYNLLCTVQS